MNKLYAIRFMLPSNYVISVWYGWSEQEAIEKMKKNPEWKFELAVDEEWQKIWNAR